MTTIAVQNVVYNKGSSMQPDLSVFTGEIIPNPNWVGDDSICITTGDPKWTFRIVRKDRIVRIDGDQIAPAAINNDSSTKTWQIAGSKGSEYIVTNAAGRWACTCKGFEFRRDCKHVRSLQGK